MDTEKDLSLSFQFGNYYRKDKNFEKDLYLQLKRKIPYRDCILPNGRKVTELIDFLPLVWIYMGKGI